MWDLRKTANPIIQINHPCGIESNVTQFKHSSNAIGSIVVGFKNGDLASYSLDSLDTPSWVRPIFLLLWFIYLQKLNTTISGKGIFTTTTFGDIICPVRGNFLFIDIIRGNIVESVESDVLISPSSIKMNPMNNVRNLWFFLFLQSLRMFLSSILIMLERSSASSPETFIVISSVKNTEKGKSIG